MGYLEVDIRKINHRLLDTSSRMLLTAEEVSVGVSTSAAHKVMLIVMHYGTLGYFANCVTIVLM